MVFNKGKFNCRNLSSRATFNIDYNFTSIQHTLRISTFSKNVWLMMIVDVGDLPSCDCHWWWRLQSIRGILRVTSRGYCKKEVIGQLCLNQSMCFSLRICSGHSSSKRYKLGMRTFIVVTINSPSSLLIPFDAIEASVHIYS